MSAAPAQRIVRSPPRVLTRTSGVEQPPADAGDHRGARAGAAGERLAGAALPHAQADACSRDDHLHVARVHAVREGGMALDERALRRDRRASTSATTCTACGLPIESTLTSSDCPPTSIS